MPACVEVHLRRTTTNLSTADDGTHGGGALTCFSIFPSLLLLTGQAEGSSRWHTTDYRLENTKLEKDIVV